MTRRKKDPLRPLSSQERDVLEQISRAESDPASHVAHAKLLLLVADGASYTEAAHAIGRLSGDAVSKLVARFNQEGLAAVEPRHGGGPPITYGPEERQRILTEFERQPDREQDGTATWSLSILQRALRSAPDGLPTVSTYTIFQVLHDTGWTWQKDRTWCKTGKVVRKRKSGTVEVTDPDAEAKKLDCVRLPPGRSIGVGPVDRGRGWAFPDSALCRTVLAARGSAQESAQ
jgi:transposase